MDIVRKWYYQFTTFIYLLFSSSTYDLSIESKYDETWSCNICISDSSVKILLKYYRNPGFAFIMDTDIVIAASKFKFNSIALKVPFYYN